MRRRQRVARFGRAGLVRGVVGSLVGLRLGIGIGIGRGVVGSIGIAAVGSFGLLMRLLAFRSVVWWASHLPCCGGAIGGG